MRRKLWLVLFLLCSIETWAQWNWYNPQNVKDAKVSFIHNQGWNEDGGNYSRLPQRAKSCVRKEVWNLACESAGLSIRFKTNAKNIEVRYLVTGGYSMPHMPSTGVSGVDLYRLTEKGEEEFCFGNYSFADTIRYSYHIDKTETVKNNSEYILYLPLYNGVKWLEIGVENQYSFSFIPYFPDKKPMILYGTSIAQGACASRPGMAWGNILSRSMNIPLVNLGFSGNGKLEKNVLDFINEQDACVFILDCMANLSGDAAKEVKELVKNAVYQIRTKHAAPILLVEHAGYSNGVTNKKQHEAYTAPNKKQKEAFDELKKEGVKNLFYLSHPNLNLHPDSWVDYVHPSDWGMVQQATAIEKALHKIMK